MAPMVAVPHAAVALGLAFLIAPSGWLVRLVSPWATGWELPPDVATVQDPNALALALGLIVKELPFLLLMTLAALGQVRADERRSEEHTSELQSLMRISYAVFCLKQK